MVHCVLRVIGCVMAGTCHAEREYPQDGGLGKAVGLYNNNKWMQSRYKSNLDQMKHYAYTLEIHLHLIFDGKAVCTHRSSLR